jgi:hypothetical protein
MALRDGFLMLLLPIIRDISIRPVLVYTRITPQISIPLSTDQSPSLVDHSQDLTYFDIRIKLERCETDAPSRLKKSESHLLSQSHELAPVAPAVMVAAKTVQEPSKAEITTPVSATAAATATVMQQKPPAVSTLYSLGAMIGTALYYGANKSSPITAPAPSVETQDNNSSNSSSSNNNNGSVVSSEAPDSEKTVVAIAIDPPPNAEEDTALLGRGSEEGRLSDQSISNQSSAMAADRIRERLARLRK